MRLRPLSMATLAVVPALPLTALPGHTAEVTTHQPASRGWVLELNQHFGSPGNASGFSTVLLTRGHLWVFGGTNPGGRSVPVIATIVGRRWRTARLPSRLSDFISDASAPGPSDIWAISSYGRYVLHFDGTRWQLVKRWDQAGSFSDIVATGSRSAWVFGTSAYGYGSLATWHYNGRSWLPVSGAASHIYRASAVSSRDVWAIEAGRSGDGVLRFDGRSWRRERVGKAISAIRWNDILAESVHNVWLVGNESAKYRYRLVLAHWNGRRWTMIVTRMSALAGQLAEAGANRVLVTATSSALLPTGLTILVTNTGRITSSTIASSFGAGISDAVFDVRTGVIWASGATLTRLGGNAAIWTRTIAPARASDDVN
jgi:hypothetical protein